MRVVVTGGTGFLGKRISYKLKALNFTPIVLGRNEVVGQHLLCDDITFLKVDLSDRNKAIASLKDADYVIHCAGLSTVWGSSAAFHLANVKVVENIIEGCFMHGIKRLVHISTPSIYFNFQDRFNISEDDPLPEKFVNEYAKSKRKGEILIQQAFKKGLGTVILRPRGIFGEGDTSILPRILSAIQNDRLPLINEGKALMDITYVENVVDSILQAMLVPSIEGGIFNITNDQPTTFAELINQLIEKLKIYYKPKIVSFKKAYYAAKFVEGLFSICKIQKEPPITCYGVGLLSKSMTLDISKAKNILGYHPKISLSEGIDKFVEWRKFNC